VALHDGQFRIVAHGAQHLDVGVVLDHRAQLAFMAAAAQLVEDHAGNADVGVEGLVAQDQRGDAARHATRIEHQHHGRLYQLGERRIAVAAVEVQAIVEPLVALDEGHVGTLGVAAHHGQDLVPFHGLEVEVVAGASRGQAQPHGIDIVRAFLEGLDPDAARSEGGAQSQGDGGLPGGLVGGGYQ
jgi:hypothetical protein